MKLLKERNDAILNLFQVKSLIPIFIHPYIHSSLYSFIDIFINPYIHSFLYSFIPLFIHLYIHSLIYSNLKDIKTRKTLLYIKRIKN